MKHNYALFTICSLFILLSFLMPLQAQEPLHPPQVGLRPDAPTYALHGPYWVGTQDFVVNADSERPLPITIWYPALNPENATESTTYVFEAKWQPSPEFQLEISGMALRDAVPDGSDAPYPLVVFSHGFSNNPPFYAYLVEHLSSYGFVVVAPDHQGEGINFEGDLWEDIPAATIERPHDISSAIDYAESVTASGGTFEGLIDLEHVAVVGHSYGGYTALAAAGARYDPVGFHQRCETDRAAGNPLVWLCDTLIPFETNMANMAGIEPITDDLWESWGDPRVDAIIPMAGDSYMFDQTGLAEITVPVMAMGGILDTGTPYEWGALPTYQYISSQQKVLVAFEGAEHGIFVISCDAAPWAIDLGFYGFCADAVWDKARVHDLINHFTTAFLLDVLKGDQGAHAVLAPDAVSFPGIQYQAQGY